jgi:autotransporter-associated beta strand protein
LNTTTDRIKVAGAAQTIAGQIIGPWATTGTETSEQTDYAVYDASSTLLPAGIVASTESTWTAGSNVTLSAGTTLTATRTLNGLRYTGTTGTLALGAHNLETFGILNGGTNTLTISGSAGVVRQPGTAAANLYVTPGNQSITVNVPIQDNTGALTLVKSGAATLTLSGANTFSGGLALNAGTLLARHGSALANGNVTMASGTALLYQPVSDAPLTIGGTLSITGGTHMALTNNGLTLTITKTVLGASMGGTATSACINVTGTAAANGPVTVNVFPISGFSPLAGTNTYTLLHGAAGSSLNGAVYALGTVYNITNFSFGSPTVTATDLTIPVTKTAGLGTAYWNGGLPGSTLVWAASNGSTQSNWVATSGGARQPLVPGAGTDIIFSGSTVTTSPSGSTLGSDMTIRSLTQNSATPVLLNSDGFTLTIASTNPAAGIKIINSGASSVSINCNVRLGADQTWTNNSGSFYTAAITVNGSVEIGASLLTIDGTGSSSIPSAIRDGAGGIKKNGNGILTLNGANTYTGTTIVNGGELRVGGSIAKSALTTVNGGVLSGTGSIGAIRTAGGTLAPGASVGTLNSGDVDFSGGTLLVQLASASFADQLKVTGTAGLSADTALVISLVGRYNPQVGDNWVLLQNDGADAFGVGAFHFTSNNVPILDNTPFLLGGETFVLQYNTGTGNDVVLTAVIPESGTLGLLLVGALGVLGRRRRSC